MKKNVSGVLFISIFLFISTTSWGNEPIRVACIGNSITYGYGLENPAQESYPAQLAQMLGKEYDVRNFGINSRTLLYKGDLPYVKEKIFDEARAFLPDIVVIKLGTNDTKPQNWKYGKEFGHDLKAIIDSFRCGNDPRIYLCLPTTVYGLRWGINDSTLVHGIIPVIKKTAKQKRTQLIDLHTATAEMKENFPDGVHPDATAAHVIAQEVFQSIVSNPNP